MHSDPLAKRKRLVKVRKRIESALEEKFADKERTLDIWRMRLKRFDALRAADKPTLQLSAEISWIKIQLANDGIFSDKKIRSFGNGHDKNCVCNDCSLRFIDRSQPSFQAILGS
ncbi:MAG: hypothetical protein KW788_02940 [Candidatus Doudnabacteria bacterium]|nr:hypothetical protein [Candidatus Doudnabacteria bacterium]